MKKALKIFKWVIISLLGLAVLGTGLLVFYLYLITQPMTTNETSRVDNIKYRVIGAELFNSNIDNCKPIVLFLYIRNYKQGEFQEVANVINHFEIHDRTKRTSSPIISKLDRIMLCPTYYIQICNKNLVKYYECGPKYRVERLKYEKIGKTLFCLTSDSGKKECFEFTWTPK